MTLTASARTVNRRLWPLTRDAWDGLVDEIANIRGDLMDLAGQGLEEGITRLPLARAVKRLETLERVLDQADLVDDASCAIGRRATVRDEQGEAMSFAIVYPGDGDPTRGWISADSPLGAAVLGARSGDVVEVNAPVGRWSVTVESVE